MLRRTLILACIAWILGIVLFGYAKMIEARAGKPWLVDFSLFYLSANALKTGDDVYRPGLVRGFEGAPKAAQADDHRPHPNLNMPVVNLLFLPFSSMSIAAAITVWGILSVGFVLAAAWMLGSHLVAESGLPSYHRWMASGLLAILFLTYFPTWANANIGQLGQLMLLGLSGAWVAARRKHDRLAGTLFGLALALKPFTGIFLVLLPWLRRWQLLRWYVGSFTALSLVGVAAVGLKSQLGYLSALRQVDWYGSGWNASLMAPLSILLGGNAQYEWLHYPRLATLVSVALSSVFYALLVRQLRQINDPTTVLDIAIAGGIPLMLLASPLGWIYYLPLVWIAALAVINAVRPLPSRWIWWLASVVMLVLCGLPFPFVNAGEAAQSLRSLLLTSVDTFALLATFAFTLCVAWRLGNGWRYGIGAMSATARRLDAA
jgi:Glycosyltransferase family 87